MKFRILTTPATAALALSLAACATTGPGLDLNRVLDAWERSQAEAMRLYCYLTPEARAKVLKALRIDKRLSGDQHVVCPAPGVAGEAPYIAELPAPLT